MNKISRSRPVYWRWNQAATHEIQPVKLVKWVNKVNGKVYRNTSWLYA